MQYILLLAILGGCAVSMDELIVEARECVEQSTNLQGVIGATEEQRTACWAAVNEKTEILFKRSERQAEELRMNEYYRQLCYPGIPVFESWGAGDTRFKGCLGRYGFSL